MNSDENPPTHVFSLDPGLAVGVLDRILTAAERSLNEAAATRAWAERSRTGIVVMAGLFSPTGAPEVRASAGKPSRAAAEDSPRRLARAERPGQGAVIGTRTMVHGLTVIGLAGDLDVAAVAELRRQLAPRPSASLPDLVVDLREVEFMDCAVVGAMVAARNEVADAGGCLRLAGPGSVARRLLALCHLDEVFCIYDTLSEATDPVCARHRALRATPSASKSEAPLRSRSGERNHSEDPRRHPGPAAA